MVPITEGSFGPCSFSMAAQPTCGLVMRHHLQHWKVSTWFNPVMCELDSLSKATLIKADEARIEHGKKKFLTANLLLSPFLTTKSRQFTEVENKWDKVKHAKSEKCHFVD